MAETTYSDTLLQILHDGKMITDAQVEEIMGEQKRTGNTVRKAVLDLGLVKEEDLRKYIL